MKKHFIAALVGVMILAVTAPAFAANVGGDMEYSYEYNFTDEEGSTAGEWSLNVNGKISDDVSFKVDFDNDADVIAGQVFAPSEAWIQAKDTAIGTVKLGAFDLAFGERNEADWLGATDDYPLNVLVGNEIAGLNIAGGAQLTSEGDVHVLGALASMEPIEALTATVGVMAERDGGGWEDPAFGYEVNYAGIENLNLGLKGNFNYEEIVGSAAYELLPGITVDGMYAKNALNDDDVQEDSRMQAGIAAKFENGLHAGASYALVDEGLISENTITTLDAGYGFELANGLVVGVDGEYVMDEDAGNDSSVEVSAGIAF